MRFKKNRSSQDSYYYHPFLLLPKVLIFSKQKQRLPQKRYRPVVLSLCFYSNVALRAFRLSRSKRWSCIIARDMSSTDTAALALACGGASNTSQPKNLQSNSKKKSHGSSAQGTHLHLRMRLRVLDAKAINPREQVP